jgi:HD-GYP domain-containing protein (c-di-GMP phosphodiesterase class II)
VFCNLGQGCRRHHERLDGKGYPHGLDAKDIGLETRIITVADFFDALTAERPYREAMTVAKALDIMQDSVGTAIDADCFAGLKAAIDRLGADTASGNIDPQSLRVVDLKVA